MLTHIHIHNTLAHAHLENSRNHNMHILILMNIFKFPIAIFFTVFLVNRQLTGLTALTKTLNERSVCVLVLGGFSELSLSESLGTACQAAAKSLLKPDEPAINTRTRHSVASLLSARSLASL